MIVIIVTGGEEPSGVENPKSVELLLDDGSPWCSLPNLPQSRSFHTQSGLVACGGLQTETSCVTFANGEWTMSHSLLYERLEHSSWFSSEQGIVLMGGGESNDSVIGNSTELLTSQGETLDSFKLHYSTM